MRFEVQSWSSLAVVYGSEIELFQGIRLPYMAFPLGRERKSPLAASACRPRGPAPTKSSYPTCGKGFAEVCGSFDFSSLRTGTHSNPSRFFSKLKRLRRVAIRYDTLASNFLAMVQLASRRLPLPITSQIILPLGLVVRPAARQLQIEVPSLRKNLWILFLHKSKDLFPNQAA